MALLQTRTCAGPLTCQVTGMGTRGPLRGADKRPNVKNCKKKRGHSWMALTVVAYAGHPQRVNDVVIMRTSAGYNGQGRTKVHDAGCKC